ncbi:mechanosensitive ion channel family protein [Victivallis sp. Marseille-Q1083]|nr:mechanosensitive ion channel family protein [Victivallis sp. Marseille-Q1083]
MKIKLLFLLFLLQLCATGQPVTGEEAAPAAAQSDAVVIVIKDPAFAEKLADVLTRETTARPDAETAEEVIHLPENANEFWHEVNQFWKKSWHEVTALKVELTMLVVGLLLTYFVAWIVNTLFWKTLLRLARRSHFKYDDLLCEKLKAPSMFLLCLNGAFMSVLPLFRTVGGELLEVWARGLGAAIAVSVIWGLFRLIDVLDRVLHDVLDREESLMDELLEELLRRTLKVVLVLLSVFFIGQNILGLNITSLLAGAGVAGLAVAFAAQETIANFFGSVTIIVDHSFRVGDWVKTCGVEGIVETMGLRSTKIRAFDGELFTVPNRQVASSVIENYARRPYIRYRFCIGMTYETTAPQMKRAREILQEVLSRTDLFDLANHPPKIDFTDFGAYSLNFTIYVWFNTGDYWQAEAWKTEINLEIQRRFAENNLAMAFPTQTLYLEK